MNDPYDRQQAYATMSDKPQQASQAEESELARYGDPSLRQDTKTPTRSGTAQTGRGGIEWVRASDLLTRGGTSVANRGAAAHENVIRKMRGGMASIPVSRSGIARRSANALPPVSVFGQTPPSQSTTRGAVGR